MDRESEASSETPLGGGAFLTEAPIFKYNFFFTYLQFVVSMTPYLQGQNQSNQRGKTLSAWKMGWPRKRRKVS